jgi:hypothetical protein
MPHDEDGEDISEDEKAMSVKKLVKIMNLCQVYVPLVQMSPNNSSKMSLDLLDLGELGRSKEKYREFVDLQAESLENIMRDSYLDGSVREIPKDTVSEFLKLLTR